MSGATPPPPPNAYQANPPLRPEDEKLWATLIHLGGILFSFLPALIGYLVLKDRGPFIRQHTAAALNFQISLAIYEIVASILIVVLIGIPLLIALGIFGLVVMIIAAVKANQGFGYTYPLAIKFVA